MIDVKHVTILAKYIVKNPKCSEQDLIKIMVSDFGLTVERAEEWLRVYILVCAEYLIISFPTFEALKITLLENQNNLDDVAKKTAEVVEMRLTEMAVEAEKQKRITELERQIADITQQITELEAGKLQYPDCDKSTEMVEAVNLYNHRYYNIDPLISIKENLEIELNVLIKGGE